MARVSGENLKKTHMIFFKLLAFEYFEKCDSV